MKRLPPLLVTASSVTATVLVVAFAAVAATKFLGREARSKAPAGCQTIGMTHTVTIKDNIASPARVDAHRCDQLTIRNPDAHTRLIGFGSHSQHVAYNGVAEHELGPGQAMTLVLNQTGTYHFHDHYYPSLKVEFVVQ